MTDQELELAGAIIRNRALKVCGRGLLDYDDASQTAWESMLKIMTTGLSIENEHDRNTISVYVRNGLIELLRKELSNKGRLRNGENQGRVLYNPLIPRPRRVEDIVHCKILSEIIYNDIMPVLPDAYRSILIYCAFEAEDHSRWQLEYSRRNSIRKKTINRHMGSLRRRIPEMIGEYYDAKRRHQVPNLRFMKDRPDKPVRRMLSYQDECRVMQLRDSMSRYEIAKEMGVPKAEIDRIIAVYVKREKRSSLK